LKSMKTVHRIGESIGIQFALEEHLKQQVIQATDSIYASRKESEASVDAEQHELTPTDREKIAAGEKAAREAESLAFVKRIRLIQTGQVDITEIAKTPVELRNVTQNSYLASYLLYQIDFFKIEAFSDREFLQSISEVMQSEHFNQGDILMRKGDKGDKMYISFSGRLGIYLSNDPETLKGQPVSIIPEFVAVGERALENPHDRRAATVVCMDDDSYCMTISKEDYKELVHVSII
jgi:hypothetical protein